MYITYKMYGLIIYGDEWIIQCILPTALYVLTVKGFSQGHEYWHRRGNTRFVMLCTSKWLRKETIEWKCLHFFVWDTKGVRSQTLSVSHNRLRDQEVHGWWRRCQQTGRQWSKDCCGSWQLAGCYSKQSIEWHLASYHGSQQSRDPCLKVCWHLRHHPRASW